MPNPTDPDETCRICHDSGYRPGTDRLCPCTGLGGLTFTEPVAP